MVPVIPALLFLGGAATVGLGIAGTNKLLEKRHKAEVAQRKGTSRKLQKELEGLKTSLRSRIDAEIQEVLVDAEKLRRHLVSSVEVSGPEEKRFSMRVDLRPDEMIVMWTDGGGVQRQTYATDASLTGIAFAARGFDGTTIDRIKVPSLNVDLVVTKAEIMRAGSAATVGVNLVEFEDNENSWLLWVELMTRVGRVDIGLGDGV
ncbi:MAG: hypothetical protein H7840_06690 [Alphaproteobacteria bacterium]